MAISARISLLDGRTMTGTTVSLQAESETPVSELVVRLKPFLPANGELYLDGRPLAYHETVSDLGLLDGVVVRGLPEDVEPPCARVEAISSQRRSSDLSATGCPSTAASP